MIVVTGAAGFIGSVLVGYLHQQGYDQILAVDDFTHPSKAGNLCSKGSLVMVERFEFPSWLASKEEVEVVFHLGARTDTVEFDVDLLNRLNLDYSKSLWKLCAEKGIPFLYASSAATYGDGSQGFKDDESSLEHLEPLNPYGQSKQDFDLWVMQQSQTPPQWSGFKFFNVYGPNEYHKNRMASVILHAFRQIQSSGAMKLFRSHHPDFKDGHQLRDFIYVKDVVHMLHWFWKQQVPNGIYNVGTGKARTFLDLTRATFKAMDQEENISFIDTPKDIRDKYQYFTEADMAKVRSVGYQHEFTSLEKGVEDYVRQYLMEDRYF